MTTQGLRVVLLSALATSLCYSQPSSARQRLLLEVVEVNKISIDKDFLALSIDHTPRNHSSAVGAASTDCALSWTTNGSEKKITVGNAADRNRYQLRLAVEEVANGEAATSGEIAFQDNGTHDFVRGVGRSAGECRLKLTAVAGLSEEPAEEVHLLTYTITSN